MKTFIFTALIFVLSTGSAHAASDYFLKLDGVKGESTTSGTASTETTTTRADTTTTVSPPATDATTGAAPTGVGTVAAPTKPQEASVDMLLEIEGIKGESKDSKKKGNVEHEWKVEEGESAGVVPVAYNLTDSDGDPVSITPDFSILFGGVEDCNDSDKDACPDGARKGESEDCDDADKGVCPERAEKAETEHDKHVFVNNANPDAARAMVADILLKSAQEQGAPIESLSLNFTKIEMKVRQEVKMFGIIPIGILATVEIDPETDASNVHMSFPWWAVFVSGENNNVGTDMFHMLSNVLKAKHDTIKNSIGNIR